MKARSLRFTAHVGPRRTHSTYSDAYKQDIRGTRASMRNIIRNYSKLCRHLEEISPDVLYNALEPTFEKSKVYCPKDTGKLVASGYLEITQFRGIPTVQIGYGKGGNPSYAAAVHENLEWRHKSPTRAKWLQVALAEDEGAIQSRIVSQYRQVFA